VVTTDGRVVQATHSDVAGDVVLSMTVPEGLRCVVHRGVESPQPAGWISRSFDSKLPTATVVMSGRIEGGARFITRLGIDFRA
jgi:hypothetical protein